MAGKTLPELRDSKNLTQEEVSEQTGISVWTLSQLENWFKPGSRKIIPSAKTMRVLAYFYGVEVQDVPEFVGAKLLKKQKKEQGQHDI